MGENGSGKSTLLQMVAGILHPSAGSVAVNGRVSALLELGAGLTRNSPGATMFTSMAPFWGSRRRQIDERYRDIEAFAEIGDFIDQPVKTYSSGMVVRLAFAVAINVDPEILLVDEALAVGDIYFRQRCMRKVHELRGRGVTIMFVSHAIADVKAVGDRVLWLDRGGSWISATPSGSFQNTSPPWWKRTPAICGTKRTTKWIGHPESASARRKSSRPSPISTIATATPAPA